MPLAEWLPLKQVALRSPLQAVTDQAEIDLQWQDLHYLGRPDFDDAILEHQTFVSILRSAGADIIELPAGSGLTLDSIYVRDTALPGPAGVIITHMGKDARQGEPVVLKSLLEASGISIAGQISAPGMLEGGDCVWLDQQTLLVGRTYRTNAEGIRQVKDILGPSINVHIFQMPHYKGGGDVFHLMSVISPIDQKMAVVYLPLMPVPMVELLVDRGFQLIEVPEDEFETMGCNVLALGNRAVVIVAGNPKTKSLLRQADIEVFEISGTHICHPGQGGPTCLTLPLLRSLD